MGRLRRGLNGFKREIYKNLMGKTAFGSPKQSTKKNEARIYKIYSQGTFEKYKKECYRFAQWAYERGGRSVSSSRHLVKEYLEERQKTCSAWTVRTEASALSMLYEIPSNLFDVVFEKRLDKNIKRSRLDAIRDRNFSEKNNADLIRFTRMCGLRRNELEHLRYSNLFYQRNKLYLRIKGNSAKGGRNRVVEIQAKTEEDILFFDSYLKFVTRNGTNFGKVNSNMDVHAFRAEYAARVYEKYARPIESLDKKEKYICRGQRLGQVYDKYALLKVSSALGHNRCDVVVKNYSYRFDIF